MPPKRKRADDPAATAMESTSTRATRSSTQLSSSTAEASNTAAEPKPAKKVSTKAKTSTTATRDFARSKSAANDGDGEANNAEPAVKKQRAAPKSKAKTTASSSRATKTAKGENFGDHEQPETQLDDKPSTSNGVSGSVQKASMSTRAARGAVAPSAEGPAAEVYSPARAMALFSNYADSDDPNVIGPEGFTQLCSDAQIPLEGALPLILAWQLAAKEMGKFSKEEWLKGTGRLQISSLSQLAMAVTDLENLLILGKPPVDKPAATGTVKKKKGSEPYDRTSYWGYAHDTKSAFQQLYTFCFVLAKPEQARNIDMETATAFWSVLLLPRYPVMEEVVEFINEKGSYKGVNKDLWSMMLEFCQTVSPTLEDYEADGAWPTLLDDFAVWKTEKGDIQSKSASVDAVDK